MIAMDNSSISLDIQNLQDSYRSGSLTPAELLAIIRQRIDAMGDNPLWIVRLTPEQLQPYIDALDNKAVDDLPLYGIPFAIKDNIDLQGVPTTAGCPDYSYTPAENAFVVQQLVDAGAIPVGKTNLDQFATGLVGTRSPYGVCRNSFNPDYISGGSSSGSAVSVAAGLVSFSLGTDTAGSGRVPAAFNNIVGMKPTRGLLSASGVVPACRSLDCVSIFALSCDDAARIKQGCETFDAADDYARPAPVGTLHFNDSQFRFGVPQRDQLQFFGNADAEALFQQSIDRLQSLGGEPVTLDFEPFLSAARLLYEGPWVSERYAAIESFIEAQPDALFPVTRQIIEAGRDAGAVEAFKAQYRLMACRRACEPAWQSVDVVLTPTAGTIYRVDEVNANPVQLNSNLGYYTNFMNLLDLSAIAVPAGFQANGLPFGVTLFAPAFADDALTVLGDRLHRSIDVTAGATGLPLPSREVPRPQTADTVEIAVCGAHLSGLPLNPQLTERGAWLLESTRTSPHYRLYALPGGPPFRPGLVRDLHSTAIELEVWAMPSDRVGSFLQLIPAPLGLGKLELQDGRWVSGFICEPCAIEEAVDISGFGGWRAYLDSLA